MNHSIRVVSLGLCLFSFACGAADNGSTDKAGTDPAAGPTWFDPVDVGDGEEATDPDVEAVSVVTDDLSYSNWQLQLPIGSGTTPTSISPSKLAAGYSLSPYFYKASDGGQIFMDPQKGVTTSGSKHPRTEMRESTSSGAQAAWSSSKTNTLKVDMKVNKVGNGGNVCIGQVFNGSDKITLIELQYSGSGRLKVFYEEAKGQGESPKDTGISVPLGTRFTYELGYSQNNVTVKINGKQVYSRKPSSKVSGNKFYFKVGAYDQTATAGTPTKTVYTQLAVYSTSLTHS